MFLNKNAQQEKINQLTDYYNNRQKIEVELLKKEHEEEIRSLKISHEDEIRELTIANDSNVRDIKLSLDESIRKSDNNAEDLSKKLREEIAELKKNNAVLEKEKEILNTAFENMGFDVKDMKSILEKLVDGIVSKNTVNVIK